MPTAPSLSTIAKAAGVSTNTVSLALRSDPRVRLETRAKIVSLAESLGYRPNPLISDLMAQLRRGATESYRGTLALINAHPEQQTLSHHPCLPNFLAGCRDQAVKRGYCLDEFWLHAPGQNSSNLNRILTARNIRGLILLGLRNPAQDLSAYAETWTHHAVVVAGVRTQKPAFNYCSVDQHLLIRDALDQARALGYRRPALALTPTTESLVDHRYNSALLGYVHEHGERSPIPGFFGCATTPQARHEFQTWYREHQPDLILTFYRETKSWLEEIGVRVPDDTGIILLDYLNGVTHWSHMDQHDRLVGADAVNLLVSMLQLNESGIPATPRATFRRATWSPGLTTRVAAPVMTNP